MNSVQPVFEFFGLREPPFAGTSDPTFFYATREHRECLFRLWTNIESGNGPFILLGPPGVGKTMLMRKMLADMSAQQERYNTAVIAAPAPSWTTFTLLESMLDRFKVTASERSFPAYLDALNTFLLGRPERIHTLIIDDAQNLNKPAQLELLRLTQNLETPQRKVLNLVLFAQQEWSDALRLSPSFLQRADVIFTLSPLSLVETAAMIRYRLERAGASRPAEIFTDDAIRLIHARTEGSQRATLTLCRNALIVAARVKARQVGAEIILYTVEKTMLPEARPSADPASGYVPEPQHDPAPAGAQEVEAPIDHRRSVTRAFEERANQLLLKAARARTDE